MKERTLCSCTRLRELLIAAGKIKSLIHRRVDSERRVQSVGRGWQLDSYKSNPLGDCTMKDRYLAFPLVLTTVFMLTQVFASDEAQQEPQTPHPSAIPNEHADGEVDRPALVQFIVRHRDQLVGIVLDETDAELVGQWQYSTHTPPYVGIGYLHDQKTGKGKKSVTYRPMLPKAGLYEVRMSHCYNIRRSTNTRVTIGHQNGETSLRINQQQLPEHKKLFRTLGRFRFPKGKGAWVKIATNGTDGKYVIADAMQFIPVNDKQE